MEEKKILVIEDNDMNLQLTKDLLEFAGFEVISATNALDGIQLAKIYSPCLILMDIALPDLDGITAAKIIQDDPDIRDIPIVALTAYAMKGDEEKALKAGFHGYITKPIDAKQFSAVVEEFIH